MRRIDLKSANVARSNTIRDINRQIVLNYVRERGPISRSEIAHETELQRSTVSLIVDELKASGLIDEGSGESTGGRPPILLSLRTTDAVAIGVDLGTARTIVAASDLAGRLQEQEMFPTNPDADKTIQEIIASVQKLLRKYSRTIEGIGVSLPGFVNPETDELYIPHFAWRDIPIADELRAATGLPVKIDNDANAAALAELWFGRPEIREVRNFIMVLVEEGVGTGIVFDGQVYCGEAGAAGEFGHMVIGKGAPVACASGSRECWEAFSSERAALARYATSVRDSNGLPAKDFLDLVSLAMKGDSAACGALKETAHYLGVGIANLIQGLAPEAVIVGGPIAGAWSIFHEDLKAAVETSLCRGIPLKPIIPSTLGDEPTIMGAISLVLAGKFASVSFA
ncbi:MAG: ROK family transcriptional regulator [Pyrinomonadaceae bacterium]|nr:ROK family transcriptional regulator [Pyrinomonadaceae bacterium]